MTKRILLFCMMLVLGIAQANPTPSKPDPTNKKYVALNNYVNYVNESIHGLVIIVKLLEGYNLDINKYVDLESTKINNYTNKDLPSDIFEDKEKWFYEISPYQWYDLSIAGSKELTPATAQKLNGLIGEMNQLLKNLNALRFKLDKLTAPEVDLKVKDNLGKVYEELEHAVQLYFKFYTLQVEIEKQVYGEVSKNPNNISNPEYQKLYTKMVELYNSTRSILKKSRDIEYDKMDFLVGEQAKNIESLKSFNTLTDKVLSSSKFDFSFSNLKKSAGVINDVAKHHNDSDMTKDSYRIYGKPYIDYNVEFLSKFNKYGSGLVFEANKCIDLMQINALKFFEMPHYFKVIYPKKLESVKYISSTVDCVDKAPEVVSDRRVVINNKVIRADGDVIELRFVDNFIVDGDVVSLNYNGDWIFRKEELEKGAKSAIIKLNNKCENYILLHADAVGSRPPNSMAIYYKYRGEEKEIVLKSDFNTSALVRIIRDNQ